MPRPLVRTMTQSEVKATIRGWLSPKYTVVGFSQMLGLHGGYEVAFQIERTLVKRKRPKKSKGPTKDRGRKGR